MFEVSRLGAIMDILSQVSNPSTVMRSLLFRSWLTTGLVLITPVTAIAQDVMSTATFLNIANVTVSDPPAVAQTSNTPAFAEVAAGSTWLVDVPGSRVSARAEIIHAPAQPDVASLTASFVADVPVRLPAEPNECRVDGSVRMLWQVTTHGHGVLTLRGNAGAGGMHEQMRVSALLMSASGYQFWLLDQPMMATGEFSAMLAVTDAVFAVEIAFSGFTRPLTSDVVGHVQAGIELAFTRTVPGFQPFGVGCAGNTGVPNLTAGAMPMLGASFPVVLDNLPVSSWNVAWGMAGFGRTTWAGNPLPFDLQPLGMPGCLLAIDPLEATLMDNLGGNATWTIPIPNRLDFAGGVFYVQGMVLDPGVNPAGAVISNAGEVRVGL